MANIKDLAKLIFKIKLKYFIGKLITKISSSKQFFSYLKIISSPNNEICEDLENIKRRKLYNALSLLIVFVIIYVMLFVCFPPNLVFSSTTTNGGDTGAHVYIEKFFVDELFPHFKMTGWSMGWFAGMPMLTFYFPLPYFFMAILSKIIGLNIAFKLVTILGSLILPITLYYFGKLFRLEYPYPELASIVGLAFLYMKSFTIYGGNFLGTFAGEFSYSISFALIFLFLGTLYRGIEREKFDWLCVISSIILCCIVLTHLITVIALLIIVPSIFLMKRNWKSARYIIAVFVVGFFISAFWSLPFVLNIKWTPSMEWSNIKSIKELLPLEIIPALTLGAVGAFFAILKKDKRMITVIWSIVVIVSIFFTWSGGRFYNARLLPFIFIFVYLLAAYGLMNLYWILITSLSSLKVRRKIFIVIVFAFIPLIALATSASIIAGRPLGPAWARHNYTGYESKADWKLYDQLMKYLDTLPTGRVMFEFDKKIIEKFGTPRSFELIPFWTKQPGMEGLLVESSLTAPFHYINQAELSVKPRGTVAGWTVPSRNYKDAIAHLKYMNIRYIMASSPEVIKDLSNDKNNVEFLNKIDPYYYYEIKGDHSYVTIFGNMPFRYKTSNWIWDMRDWYFNINNLDSPVIYDDGSKEIQKYEEIKKEDLGNVPQKPIIGKKGSILYEKVDNEKIFFTTTGIGQPHLIKVSYFPNWKVIGAEGPYLVSPSFMLVIPTQSNVTIYYGKTLANKLGLTLTYAGWGIISLVLILNLTIFLRQKRRKQIS
jgi:hypothetical protein